MSEPARGRRMLFQLYLYQSLLFASVAIAVFVVGRFVFLPSRASERREALSYVVEGLLARADSTEALRREVLEIGPRIPFAITVYTEQGSVVASAGTVLPPLDGPQLQKLARDHTLSLSPEAVAVLPARGNGGHYAVATWTGAPGLGSRAPITLFVILAALGLGSIPLARAIARPLERLAQTTRAFGLGDLRVRAEPHPIRELGDVARAFNQMADRVESLRRAEKELLANVSHELRTPLARIRVVVELAAEEDAETAQRYLADIAEDLTDIDHLLDDIIATARLDLENERSNDPYPQLRLSNVSIAALVESLAKRFREHHPRRALVVTQCGALRLDADRALLKRAIANVLDNAEKYSPGDRPIELNVRDGADGGAEGAAESDEVTIEVIDHGQGMSPEDRERVFTAFYRGDHSRTRATGGVGLGLTLAKRIVEAHGGRIAIESAVDAGTKVTITLGGLS